MKCSLGISNFLEEISNLSNSVLFLYFFAKMGSIKDRNGMDLTEAEDIKKRWQGYTEELYKKDLHDPDNNDGLIPHSEPDILESEVKWALEIAGGGGGERSIRQRRKGQI